MPYELSKSVSFLCQQQGGKNRNKALTSRDTSRQICQSSRQQLASLAHSCVILTLHPTQERPKKKSFAHATILAGVVHTCVWIARSVVQMFWHSVQLLHATGSGFLVSQVASLSQEIVVLPLLCYDMSTQRLSASEAPRKY